MDYIQDIGHGWFKVKLTQLHKLGIENDISTYSYQRGEWAYLEEDCDMGTFMRAKGWLTEEGKTIDGFWDSGAIRHQNSRMRDSAIRSYGRYFIQEV